MTLLDHWSQQINVMCWNLNMCTNCLFAAPLTNVTGDTIAQELTSTFFRYSNLTKAILFHLGIPFVSKLMHELKDLFKVQLDHACLKHPHPVGVAERCHSALERIVKFNTKVTWTDCLKYVQLVTLIQKTSCHSAIGCTLKISFHQRDSIKSLNLRFSNTLIDRFLPKSVYHLALQDAMNKTCSQTKAKLSGM